MAEKNRTAHHMVGFLISSSSLDDDNNSTTDDDSPPAVDAYAKDSRRDPKGKRPVRASPAAPPGRPPQAIYLRRRQKMAQSGPQDAEFRRLEPFLRPALAGRASV